jgi:predicted Zn-dependent peptidase
MCLGVEGAPYSSDDRYALAVLNTILGSSVSSRLFQEIREKKGYAYSIYSFVSSYQDTGVWGGLTEQERRACSRRHGAHLVEEPRQAPSS